MKSLIGKLGMLALLATGVVAGCSSSQTPSTGTAAVGDGHEGNVGLSLVPVSGVTLNSVHYTVSNGGPLPVSEGDLPTVGTASTFSFGLPLPVGTGYTISLSAASAETGDDITCAGSYGPFAVTPNSSTAFTLTLTCKDNSNGSIVGGIDVKTDACPRLVFDYAVATPSAANVGGTIAVGTKAHDLDGKTVSYAWKIATPTAGTFAPTTGATSVFTCGLIQNLGQTVTVTASNGECTKDLTTTLSCKSVLCGNGVVDPGESCDTATVCGTGAPASCIPGNKCTSNCVFTCGNGIVEPPAEACEPKGTANCNDSCQVRTPTCLDTFISLGEECDPTATPPVPVGSAPGATCDQTCKIHGPVCGNGTVEAGENCDPGLGVGVPSPACSADCKIKVSTDACVNCEATGDCAASVDNCKGPATAPFNAVQQAQCYATMACIESSNCLDGAGTLGKCYCGTVLSTTACGAAPFDLTAPGAPAGPCATVIQAGMTGFTSNSAILAGLTASSKPAGAGDQRLNCQKTAGCTDICGFTPGGPAFP